ncbi:MAG: PilZ domain-containing protein [Bdellovibrionales bacterium]|nr:PilZ domain-containing protein [Bdellovibrionales bacterium]
MKSNLRKFIPRAPRYVLKPNDEGFLRFASGHLPHHTCETILLNLSETGLAFLVETKSAPPIGDVIRIEFSIPGGDHLAWFAKVVRLEEPTRKMLWHQPPDLKIEEHLIVGVRFQDLPAAQQKLIRLNLNKKFNEILSERYRAKVYEFLRFFADNFWRIISYLALTALTIFILYYFSRPDDNYDAKRGAPWGQRYPQFNFSDQQMPANSP